jgi:4-amino-4-deoxy-L-arabinose transferase-like glycosyltransferase
MLKNKTTLIIFFVMAGLMLVSYFAGLYIDVTRDSGKYATIAKEIYQNRNYINLTVHGEPYDQKPPMLFWLGAIGFAIGKISNFWFKLPVLLLVFFGFYSAYKLGESLYNRRVGMITVLLLAFSVIYSLYSMDVHTDTPLQAFVTFALWQFHEFIKTGKNKHWILGFFGTGLAMLTKGPYGAVVPALAVAGHLLLKKKYRSFANYRWYLGILLSFVMLTPALAGLINQFGIKGLTFFFWDNNVGRLTGTYLESTNDPLFYLHNLLFLFLPWSLLFFISVYFEFRSLIKNKFRSQECFTLTGIWILVIVLSVSKNQMPNYIFVIMPLIAVLTAKWIDIALREKPKLLKSFNSVQMVIFILLCCSIGIISFYLFPEPPWQYWIIAGTGLLSALYIIFISENRAARLLFPSAIVFACLSFLLNTHVYPYIFSFQAPPKAARLYNEIAGKDDILYNYNYTQYELFFYSKPQAKQLPANESVKSVAGKKGNWIFTDGEGFEYIKNLNLKADKIIEYRHLYLNRGGLFINPKTRNEVLKPMYLIIY